MPPKRSRSSRTKSSRASSSGAASQNNRANQAKKAAPQAPEPVSSRPVRKKQKVDAAKPIPVANQTLRQAVPELVEGQGTAQPDGLPPLDLLEQSTYHADPNEVSLEAQEKARLIEETLTHFGVPAKVIEINQGPRVTLFGVEPGFIESTQRDGSVKRRKVKVNAITALTDDLALALAARSIRIQARVPGRTYVGIELPNDNPETVTLHSVLTSQAFQKLKGDDRSAPKLIVALGRDVSGRPVAADIARMPHMLIAGATGAGKSVCVNAIIASLLFNLTPNQLKVLLIDPKRVELVPYTGVPHLIRPVMTNMEKVVDALTWTEHEMDRRYELFSQARKRNLASYNKWARNNGQKPLPYIVIIIDELADLMMIAADDVEQIICRLAQMARATGIHLILATQRPSVDVVTGLIKANIPTRISFAVASGTDSRVILDSTGAENLLGRGDMLYLASDASQLQRIQGCFVSDEELQDLVDYWLDQKSQTTHQQAPKNKPTTPLPKAASQEPTDELLAKAIALTEQYQSVSITLLQRKLRISYTRAARLIETLEKRGIIRF